MIYYISDPHFGHSNIITLCDRPFEDVAEMNKTIIDNWNARVRSDDAVYVLGDVAYKCSTEEAEMILRKLNGHKHLIVGNHDEWMNKIDAEDYFESVDNLIEINDNGHRCVLCHYPMLSWNHENKAYMIYGHIHNDAFTNILPYVGKKQMLNAGVEFNNYMPVTLSELITNNNLIKEMKADNIMTYRGIVGSAQVSVSDRCMYGTLLGVNEIAMYDGETFDKFEKSFQEMVDSYIGRQEWKKLN